MCGGTWNWRKVSADDEGVSGDFTKQFKNESVNQPGHFAVNAPTNAASLMVREVVQNSWDSAIESNLQIPFEVHFHFKNISSQVKSQIIETLDLKGLSDRLRKCEETNIFNLGLGSSELLRNICRNSEIPLPILEIREHGAGGMYGSWEKTQSKMWMALCSSGITKKSEGGGSFGYGKGGLIGGTKCRIVIAYSCFQSQPDEPDITRRLLGMIYWDTHELENTTYYGMARFGEHSGTSTKPFENEYADEIAERLGISVRSKDDKSDFGTSFLLLEPSVTAEDLKTASERYWWPALEDRDKDFDIKITNTEGDTLIPRPMMNSDVKAFVEAYRVATIQQDNALENIAKKTIAIDYGKKHCGELAITFQKPGWSYPEYTAEENRIEHVSLIALIRKPRMVVEYLSIASGKPYVRGVFVADSSVDGNLRDTEPKAHDKWQTKSDDVDQESIKISRLIQDRIKGAVREFRASLKPPTPVTNNYVLPKWDSLIKPILGGSGQGGGPIPISQKRDFTINQNNSPEYLNGLGQLKFSGSAKIGISEHAPKGKNREVNVKFSYRFLEEGKVDGESHLTVDPPSKFKELKHLTNNEQIVFGGTLEYGKSAEFSYQSQPYNPDWTGRLFIEVSDTQSDGN